MTKEILQNPKDYALRLKDFGFPNWSNDIEKLMLGMIGVSQKYVDEVKTEFNKL